MQEFVSTSFFDFEVNVIECPNLYAFPFLLPTPGIGNQAKVLEFGNHRDLYDPSKNKDKSWKVPDYIDRSRDILIVGGSMFRGVPNKDVVTTLYSQQTRTLIDTNYSFINEQGEASSERVFNFNPPPCNVFGTYYVCNGTRSQVLLLRARRAFDPETQILSLMQNALCQRYVNAHVGLSGLILMTSGLAEVGVMPPIFPETLLENETDIYNWNYKYNIAAPVVVHNTMFNFDELRLSSIDDENEDMFCTVNSNSNYILRANQFTGSRFLKCSTPVAMECVGYFNVVSELQRIGAELIH
ncbi:hypothetical protein PUN28_008965 [Cardiocondyla obscurior]